MKIAVFMSGPIRYADLVRQNLARSLGSLDYDIFYHVWKEDLGNKIRAGCLDNYGNLPMDIKTKMFIIQDPYSEEFYKKYVGVKTNSNSTINATMGMFLAVNVLCSAFKKIPDSKEYTHILRIRTDCSLLSKDFYKLLDNEENVINICENPNSSKFSLGDHLFFAPRKLFLDMWSFNNMEEIYEYYKKSNRQPERTVRYMYDKRINKEITLKKNILRYKDYQIIYSPAKEDDPEWVKEIITSGNYKEIFLNPEKYNINNEAFIDRVYTKQTNITIYDNKILMFMYLIIKKFPRIHQLTKNIYRRNNGK